MAVNIGVIINNSKISVEIKANLIAGTVAMIEKALSGRKKSENMHKFLRKPDKEYYK